MSPATSMPLANDNRAVRSRERRPPRRRRPATGWLMGVRFTARRQGDDGPGHLAGGQDKGGHDTGTRAIRTAGVGLGDGGRLGVRGAAAAGCRHAARPAAPRTTLIAATGRGAALDPGSTPQGHNGRFGVYFAPWAVSDGASRWLTVEEAMEAADRYVAGYLGNDD
jgi:hypothetical protein